MKALFRIPKKWRGKNEEKRVKKKLRHAIKAKTIDPSKRECLKIVWFSKPKPHLISLAVDRNRQTNVSYNPILCNVCTVQTYALWIQLFSTFQIEMVDPSCTRLG